MGQRYSLINFGLYSFHFIEIKSNLIQSEFQHQSHDYGCNVQ